MAEVTDSTVKLDPAGASALIAQGEQHGMDAALAAGAGALGAPSGGASPVDVACAGAAAAESGMRTAYSAASSTAAAARAVGGEQGVRTLSEIESQNTVRQAEVGQAAAVVGTTTLI
ncbi:hypothetical protein ONA92_27005 [Mycobacteroides salmoniphilum]|uniref:hypothetical protein n=1 Tax=Mycobacteroides salmoniphilum TaxID=404941 RepID=UPI0035672AC6